MVDIYIFLLRYGFTNIKSAESTHQSINHYVNGDIKVIVYGKGDIELYINDKLKRIFNDGYPVSNEKLFKEIILSRIRKAKLKKLMKC